jgi:hypothetical protein
MNLCRSFGRLRWWDYNMANPCVCRERLDASGVMDAF